MAKVLLTWELGDGYGSVANLRGIGMALARRGHQVLAMVRDLPRAYEVLKGTDIAFIPAPVSPRSQIGPFVEREGLGHLLADDAFGSVHNVEASFRAWNALFERLVPDLLLMDRSPTALLASRGLTTCRVAIGVGFSCPPLGFPLPFWSRGNKTVITERVTRDERRLTDNLNGLLREHKRPPLPQMSQLFNEVDDVLLTTYPEVDPYGPRPGVKYWGHWPSPSKTKPVWPQTKSPKVFAYLEPFPALEDLLRFLSQKGLSTLVISKGIDPILKECFAGPTLHIQDQLVDLVQAAQEADLAILNAGHGTAMAMALRGTPSLLIPIEMEQVLLAQKLEQLGVGRIAPQAQATEIFAALEEMLASSKYKEKAQAFATRYRDWDPRTQVEAIAERIERLAVRSHA